MRRGFLGYALIVLLMSGVSVLGGGPLGILSVMENIYKKEKFTRISEYFTGIEDTGGDTIFRTNECGREGIYLVICLNRSVSRLSEGAFLRFRYVLSDGMGEEEMVFEIDPRCGNTSWIYVGVTGPDYHGACQYLKAWQIEICSGEERVIRSSYLWAKG